LDATGGPIRQFRGGGPEPLGIGNVTLDSGEMAKCFICEPYALAAATEITRFGGWRNYLSSLNS